MEVFPKKRQTFLEKKILLDKEKFNTFKDFINKAIDDIKNSNDWIIISVNKLKKEQAISTFNLEYIFREIACNSNIEKRRSLTVNGKFVPENARPISFRWNDNTEAVISSNFDFYNIDSVSKEYLSNVIKQHKDINVNTLLAVYKFMHDNALNRWTKITVNDIATHLRMYINKVYDALNLLYKDGKLLCKVEDNKFLFFSLSIDIQKDIHSQDKDEKQLILLDQKQTTEEDIDIKEDKKITSSDSLNSLKNNIIGFFDLQKQTVSDLFIKQSNRLQQTQVIVDKLIANNNEISAKCKEQQQEIEQLRLTNAAQAKELEALKDYSFKFLANATEVLETMLGEMANMADEFVSIPRYALNGNESSKFKGKLFKLVGDKSNEITKFKPESKFPKGEI